MRERLYYYTKTAKSETDCVCVGGGGGGVNKRGRMNPSLSLNDGCPNLSSIIQSGKRYTQ